MKLYVLQQQIYHEGNFGDLENGGLQLIGVYTDKSIPKAIMENYKPIKFHAQFGSGLQKLFLKEIDSDMQFGKIATDDNLNHQYEEDVPEYNEQ